MLSEENLKAAKSLVIRYRKITFEEIEKETREGSDWSAVNRLTGFGKTTSCPLCKSVGHLLLSDGKCDMCIYKNVTNYDCVSEDNYKTYYHIAAADSSKSILFAIRNRANYLEGLIKKYESEVNNA